MHVTYIQAVESFKSKTEVSPKGEAILPQDCLSFLPAGLTSQFWTQDYYLGASEGSIKQPVYNSYFNFQPSP